MATKTAAVLQLQAEAFFLMQRAQYKLAADHFNLAINLVEKFHDHAVQSAGQNHHAAKRQRRGAPAAAQPAHQERSFSPCLLKFLILENSITVPASVASQESLSPVSLYDKALAIVFPPPTPTTATQAAPGSNDYDVLFESEYQCGFLLGVLFYNIGLCLQLQALAMGKDAGLMESLTTYNMAVGIIDDLLLRHDDDDHHDSARGMATTTTTAQQVQQTRACRLLLDLALTNNSCHIHCHLVNMEEEEACIERMEMAFYDITDGGETRIAPSLARFFLNTLQNRSVQLRQAPVA